MSEAGADKRFDATPSRRERAKREGNAARSHEAASIAGVRRRATRVGGGAAAARRRGRRAGTGSTVVLAVSAFVPAACAAIAGTSVTIAQTGGLAVRAAEVRVRSQLAPLPGLKRMFGMEAAVAAARARRRVHRGRSRSSPPIAVRAVAAATAQRFAGSGGERRGATACWRRRSPRPGSARSSRSRITRSCAGAGCSR